MRTRIGIIGDFRAENATHLATNAAIGHALAALGERDCQVKTEWLATDRCHDYASFAGLLCSPGSPYASMAGALEAIQYAREHDVPLLGTCGGFQHMVIEYARNVIGIEDAAHAETDPYASRLVVNALSCSLVGKTIEVRLTPGSEAARVFGGTRSMEAFYCNFGLNPEYIAVLEEAGLKISGHDQDGEARVIELPDHPFYFGTLFVPQARSKPGAPHALVVAFCEAALRRG